MHLLLVDDHPLFREALCGIVRSGVAGARIDEAQSIDEAKAVLGRRPGVELIVLDLSMKGTTGFEGLVSLRALCPRIPILVCSGLEEPRIIREALRLGAAGFVPKSAAKADYLEAFERILKGAVYVPAAAEASNAGPAPGEGRGQEAIAAQIAALTPAQMRVLSLIKRGKINKQIAHELGIGASMVKAHVSEIMRKLGVRNRTQVALRASALDFDRVGL